MWLQQIFTKERIKVKSISALMTSFILVMLFSTTAFAEEESNGGDGFRETAVEYEKKAKKYKEKGMQDIVAIYTRMAEIKRHAASLADEGRWDNIDWSEYEELDEKLIKLHENKKYKK